MTLPFLFSATPAFAAVNPVPVAPKNVVVFPERDFVEAEGFTSGQRLFVRVLRDEQLIGTAGMQDADGDGSPDGVVVGGDGTVEVNHPGGACWDTATPDLIAGDVVQFLSDLTPGAEVGESATTQHVSAEHAYIDGTTVVVKGVASDGNGGRLPIDLVEQRIINPAFTDTDIGRRDIRAVSEPGAHGTLSYDGAGPQWTAVYTGLDAEERQLAVEGQTRVLAWQHFDTVAASRQGITIFEEDEVNGPGMPECPASASWAVTGSSPRSVNLATQGQDVTITGTSYDSSSVTVSLDDDGNTMTSPLTATATPSPASGAQTWSVTFPSTAVRGLSDGKLTASARYGFGAGTVGGTSLTILKDLSAPAAPTASPAAGTYADSQSVTLTNAERLPMHFTVDGTEPGADDPVHSSPLRVTADQTLKAIVVDDAGNPSPVSSDGYVITGARAGATAEAGPATPDPAPAARNVQSPPLAPRNVVVFPERDFMGVEGFKADSPVTIRVLRNGALVGTATATTDATGFVEVNHPGGVCWQGVTPDIRSGDVVEVLEDTTPGHEQGAATTVAFVSITQPAQVEALTGDVVVRGTAHDGSGDRVDLGNLEQRIINPALQDQPSVDKRHVSAVTGGGGEGTLAYDGTAGTEWTARFSGYGATVDQLLVDGQSRIMSWQAFTADRQGLTIWEHGEVNGPGMPECPGAAEFAVVASTPSAVNIANAGDGVTVSGTANGATAVTAKLTDGSRIETVAATLSGSGADQTWTATFSAAQVRELADGTLTASAAYTAAAPVLGAVDLPILKDLTAPATPSATPGGARYNSLQAVSLSNPSEKGLAIHYTLDNTNPHSDDPAYSGQIELTGDTTLRAVAIDAAGNESPQLGQVYEFVPITSPTISLDADSDTGSSSTDRITKDTTPTFSGSADDGTTVSLRANGVEVGTSTVTNGTWQATASTRPAGTADYTAVALLGGRQQASGPLSVTVDTAGPTTGITSAPASNSTDPAFGFSANEDATFECSMATTATDSFAACTSPKSYGSIPDGTYTFEVRGTDVAGNTGGTASRVVTLDRTAPTATAPKATVNGTTMPASLTTSIRLEWSGSDGSGTGISSYRLERSTDGTTWTTVSTGTATSRTETLGAGTHRYRVTATDGAGNVGTAAASTFTLTLDQEGSTKIAYAGSWTQASQTGSSGGAVRHASASTAKATHTFNGTSVAWISTRGRDRGRADVYLDGVRVAQVDLYRGDSNPEVRYIAYRADGLTKGSHTLEVRVLGTRNGNSRGTRVDVDAFVTKD